MFNPVILLVLIRNVGDIFVNEGDNIQVLGMFRSVSDAEMYREYIANTFEHGDRLVIMDVHVSPPVTAIDTIVIVDERVN